MVLESMRTLSSTKHYRAKNWRRSIQMGVLLTMLILGCLVVFLDTLTTSVSIGSSDLRDLSMSMGYNKDHDYKACDRPLSRTVKESWNMIDKTLHDRYPSHRVSGGIFLYPRQASLLTTLLQEISSHKNGRPVTVCETGFGAGHSMVLFADAAVTANVKELQASKKQQSEHGPIQILSFDKYDRPYQLDLWHMLNATMTTMMNLPPHSFRYIRGNSCRTVPTTLSEELGDKNHTCDVLHGSSLCPTDNVDLVEHSPCGSLLTSTAMGNLEDPAVYFGPKAQWRTLRDRGCITQPICFQEAPLQLKQNYVFGGEGQSFTSVFCIAIVTGICSRIHRPSSSPNCGTHLFSVVSTKRLEQFCPSYQIPVPP